MVLLLRPWYDGREMTTISVKLPDSVAEQLAAEAFARQTSISALVREFIDSGLNCGDPDRSASFHALAKDKGNRFPGPRDLATNPKHMEGFGR